MTNKTEESKTEQKAEEETTEKAEVNKDIMELNAKLDKIADLLGKFVEKQTPEEEEEKPVEEEEEKQDETPVEPTPEEQCKANGGEWVDGECKMPEEKVEEAKEEKQDISKIVEEAVKKALATPSIKKSLVPKTVEQVFPTYSQIAKLSWAEVEELAQKYGAPTRRF